MTVTLPPGTPLTETDKLVGEISSRHAKDPNVGSIYGVSGAGTRLDANPTESGENIARLSIALANGGSKKAEADEGGPPSRRHGQPIGCRSEIRTSAVVQFFRAAGSRDSRLRARRAGQGRPPARRSDEGLAAFRRHQVDGRKRLSGNPDPLRPGPCRCAGPDHARHCRPRRAQGQGRGRHALRLPRSQDRCAGALAPVRPRQCGRHPQSRRRLHRAKRGQRGGFELEFEYERISCVRHRLFRRRLRVDFGLRHRTGHRHRAEQQRHTGAPRVSRRSRATEGRAKSTGSVRNASRSSRRICVMAISAARSRKSTTSWPGIRLQPG